MLKTFSGMDVFLRLGDFVEGIKSVDELEVLVKLKVSYNSLVSGCLNGATVEQKGVAGRFINASELRTFDLLADAEDGALSLGEKANR